MLSLVMNILLIGCAEALTSCTMSSIHTTGMKKGSSCGAGEKGYFVQPTVFSNVTDDMTIARDEIFGPVQSILKWSSLDEASSFCLCQLLVTAGCISTTIGRLMSNICTSEIQVISK